MAVRDALLALLTTGPAYGFQLHGGLAERTGGRRVVNVGQTYATLERLAKQRLVEPAGTTSDGLPLHRLTPAGEAAATAWLSGADATGADAWDETVDRVLIALSLPHADSSAIVASETAKWRERHTDAMAEATGASAGRAALASLAARAEAARARAALDWLSEAASRDAGTLAFAPSSTRPKRGRRPAAPAA
jgi:DNA-binding PadR family transcriptional regulator